MTPLNPAPPPPRPACSYDETSDALFYEQPRFVTHIDDGAIGALTKCGLCWRG